jgi:membrane associated rhomboid family serine protease
MPRINITPVVLNLIIINVLVFIAFNLAPDKLIEWLPLWKSDLIFDRGYDGLDLFKPLQLVTSFFSHIDLWHIVLNMLGLFSFGTPLETVMGSKRFLIAYLICGLGQTVLCAFVDPSDAPVLGASGALLGMMVIFAFYFPQAKLGLMFLPFQFNMKKFLIVGFAISVVLIIAEQVTGNSMGGISHFGHVAGMVMGFAYLHIGKLRKTLKR